MCIAACAEERAATQKAWVVCGDGSGLEVRAGLIVEGCKCDNTEEHEHDGALKDWEEKTGAGRV